jgi:hypothetical protein
MDGWEWFCAKCLPWISLPLLLVPPALAWPVVAAFEQLANSNSGGAYVAFPVVMVIGLVLGVVELMLLPLLFAGNLWGLVLLARSQRSIGRVVQLAFAGINILIFGGLTVLWVLGGCQIRPMLPS